MKGIKVIFLLLIVSLQLNAQFEINELSYGTGGSFTDLMATLKKESVVGHPLGFEEWPEGYFITKSGDTSSLFLINYNTINNQVYLQDASTKEIFNTDETLIQQLVLTMDGEQHVFHKLPWSYFQKEPVRDLYCRILVDKPSFSLLKYHDKIYVRAAMKQDSYSGEVPDKYQALEIYFWRDNNDSPYEQVYLTKSTFKSLFNAEQRKRLSAYRKENKFKWSDKEAVVAMVEAILE